MFSHNTKVGANNFPLKIKVEIKILSIQSHRLKICSCLSEKNMHLPVLPDLAYIKTLFALGQQHAIRQRYNT